MENKFLVGIRCMTYNQSLFIEDALNGFAIQQTSFPFICIIVDDASTDGEQEVIRKYLHNFFYLVNNQNEETGDYVMTFAQHKFNKNCFFAVYFLKYNHYKSKELSARKMGYINKWNSSLKYIAICEGDDYWCESTKLQRQFDFLENNQDYSLVYTDAYVVDKFNKVLNNKKSRNCSSNALKELLAEGNFIITATSFFCNYWAEWEKEKNSFPFTLKMGDYPLWLYLSTRGRIRKLDFFSAVYRILPESASHTHDKEKLLSFIDNAEKITKFFNNKYYGELSNKQIEIRHLKGKTRLMAKISRKSFIDHWKLLLLENPLSIFDLRLSAIAFVRIVLNKSR